MSLIPYQNGNYQFKRGDTIFTEGHNTQSVNIFLNGKADVYISPYEKYAGMDEEEILKDSYRIFSIDKNTFIGANDLFLSKKFSFSYKAADDTAFYVFIAQSLDHIKTLINSQKDYSAHMVTSITNLVDQSYQALNKLERLVKEINLLEQNLIIFFWALKEELGFSHTPTNNLFRDELDKIEKMREKKFLFPSIFEASFFEKDYSMIFEEEHVSSFEINISKMGYYKHLMDLQLEIRKNFFGADFYLTSYHCRDVSKLLEEIQFRLKEEFIKTKDYFNKFYSEQGECIFKEYIKIASDFSIDGSGKNTVNKVIDYMLLRFGEILSHFEADYKYKTGIDCERLFDISEEIKLEAAKPVKKDMQESSNTCKTEENQIPEELIDSARKILEYSDIPKERADLFWSNLMAFRNLKDKLSSDEEVRSIRSSVTDVFFEIYKSVFKKVILEKNTSRLYHMFLTYAYMDEKLLCPEHVIEIYKLFDKPKESGLGNVYNTADWLAKVYKMEKDPSINEFGHDYFDIFRDMKKRGEVQEKDKFKFDNDIEARLTFEIDNMLKINQRLCHGQIGIYFPILHSEMIIRDLAKSLVTPEKIVSSVNKLLEADFSAFHRELSFNNYEKGIDKEYIMKAVIPDFILMPTFGTRAIMWQEITGRNRNSPGRFILPIFTCENMDELIVRLVGNYRWDLCKTMEGVGWSDVTQKSLTSEYADYIQFYKKNRDLSEEGKEKVRIQIQKYRNRLRDIFTSDYEAWVNYESKGNMRLNKIVRGIFFKYCPFPKATREFLEKQPMYTDIAVQFRNIRAKIAKETESRYNKYIKAGIVLEPEYEQNLIFYKEL